VVALAAGRQFEYAIETDLPVGRGALYQLPSGSNHQPDLGFTHRDQVIPGAKPDAELRTVNRVFASQIDDQRPGSGTAILAQIDHGFPWLRTIRLALEDSQVFGPTRPVVLARAQFSVRDRRIAIGVESFPFDDRGQLTKQKRDRNLQLFVGDGDGQISIDLVRNQFRVRTCLPRIAAKCDESDDPDPRPGLELDHRGRHLYADFSMSESINAHIAGTVWKIEVKVGDSVEPGQTVVILESMKMEMPVESEIAGTVTAIRVAEAQAVAEGQPLVDVG
jgi:acetyl-CoA carboxylase biotin carboxyl carrier protein